MLTYQGQSLQNNEGETVLDCLLRYGIGVPYSCKSGLCQTCIMRAVKGSPSPLSQKSLKPNQQTQGYFLACSCVPDNPLEIVDPDAEAFQHVTTVADKTRLNQNTLRLRLNKPKEFAYQSGQYLTIYKNEHIGRCYSIASVPSVDQYLEFHVRIYENGDISSWLAGHVDVGDALTIGEALGTCTYIPEHRKRPLLLIGSGTGLAPLYGIVRQALFNQHEGGIHLFHGSHTNSGIYFDDQLNMLARDFNHFTYSACVSGEPAKPNYRQGRATDIALTQFPQLKDWLIYICGNANMVNATKQKAFLAGAALKDIFADPFVHAN